MPNTNKQLDEILGLVREQRDDLDTTAMKSDQHPIDPRKGVMYFDLDIEYYNIDEDIEEALAGDDGAAARLAEAFGDDWKADAERNRLDVNKLESEAMKEVQRFVGKFSNEGHGSGGELICKIPVSDHGEVEKVWDKVQRAFGGGDDIVYLSYTPYASFGNWTLYPQGVNGPSFGTDGRDGDIDDWLDDNDPRAGR